jgi:translation elongation factor EF-G
MHKALVEAAAENDEGLMEKFFDKIHLTEDEMREGIRKGLACTWHVPRILRMCRQGYGRSPSDGVLG